MVVSPRCRAARLASTTSCSRRRSPQNAGSAWWTEAASLARTAVGGDRHANFALYHIALTRARADQPTRDYLDRRTTQGRTRREAIRCIKRFIAREVYGLIRQLNFEKQTLPIA